MSRCYPSSDREQSDLAWCRPRLLLVAYACSPDLGSEGGVGWNRALEAAKVCDTWVLCEETEFAPSVRRYLAEHGDIPGLHFEFLPQHKIESRLWSLPGLGYLAYNRWQRRALAFARRLHAEIRFDLVHQITFGTYREPGYMAELGIPWVWGPFGGTQNYPWQFLGHAGLVGAVREATRNAANRLQLRLSPRIRRAARRADAVIAANSTVQHDFQQAYGIAPHLLSDVGIQAIPAARSSPVPVASGPLRILWAGHCITRKALNLLIESLGRLPADVRYELRVLGEGPARRRWQRLAQRRGVADRITWAGRLSHRQTLEAYARADVFAFTSLRDTTGCVVVEALSNGLPVVCLDHQGAHDVVTPECGVKVPVTTPRETIGRLAEALTALARDPARRERLRRGAVRRAEEYLWTRQGQSMAEVYRQVLDQEILAPRAARRPAAAGSGRLTPVLAQLRQWAMSMAEPLDRLLGRAAAGFGILVYHRIATPVAGVVEPTHNVSPERFRAQMRGLLQRGYTAWPLRRAIEWHRQGRAIPPRTFVVTFDDGYENFYTQALPILRELDIPATLFLATGFLDGGEALPYDDWTAAGTGLVPAESWRPLSMAQCDALAEESLIELGCHTHRHENFAHRPDAFRRDLEQSLSVLRDRFGVEQATFAFPYGICGPELKAEVRRAGLLCSLSTASRRVLPLSDPVDWGRITVEPTDSAAAVASRLEGWYRALQDAWHRFRELASPPEVVRT